MNTEIVTNAQIDNRNYWIDEIIKLSGDFGADTADVECVAKDFSFVADAKAFRLSRSAKNQKDFKIQAMDNWKNGKLFAMIICPIYQLPYRTSQIYHQAASRSVLIFSYTQLCVLVRFAVGQRKGLAIELLHNIFQSVDTLIPSKVAVDYWQTINNTMLSFHPGIRDIWIEEKIASNESIGLAKEEALIYFAHERERIMRLSRKEAIQEILKISKIDNKIKKVESVSHNGLLTVGDNK